jgi:glycosyltransferase involved in cell wall biosynthesis
LVVLPNGVDLDYFSPMEIERDPATIIFTGKMSYHANVAAALDLAHQVMPVIWQQLPEAKLVIAGKDPTPELLNLASDSRISVTGTVPDLRPYLAQATVAVLPMRYGVGIQNKVLEAMAMGTPVITTSQTLAALQTTVEQDILSGDTPQAIAQAAIKLLTNADLCQKIGQGGRRYVETHHDWQVVAERLEAVYREVT